MSNPGIVILISGKRKSGKDYVSEKLKTIIGEKCEIVRISEPIKSHYANENNLSLTELLSEGPYKEKYRLAMVLWSDEIRKKEPGFFCKSACEKASAKPVLIVSDIRRKTDLKWFKETYGDKIKTVRIAASNEVRKERGWIFTEGIDNVNSECDLDDYEQWDLNVTNNTGKEFEETIESILKFI